MKGRLLCNDPIFSQANSQSEDTGTSTALMDVDSLASQVEHCWL